MIRKATVSDLDAVEAGYMEQLLYEQAHGVTTNWALGLYPTRETAEAALSAGTLYVLEGGAVCASMICNAHQAPEYASADWAYPAAPDEVLVLHTLCIPPSMKGRGCGRRMVAYYAALARQLGCTVLRLDTWVGNDAANAFYRRLGFRFVGSYAAKLQGVLDETLNFYEQRLSLPPSL